MIAKRYTSPHSGLLIKICGVTQREDAKMISDLGVDAIGLNFFAGSPRFLSLSKAEQVVQGIPNSVARVGVTVNAEFAYLEEIRNSGLVDMFQFHGDENIDYLREAMTRGLEFYLAKRVRCAEEIQALRGSLSAGSLRLILLDAWDDNSYGGSGKVIDWESFTSESVFGNKMTCILAGGLNSHNVRRAIFACRPNGVDVASGVESRPGIKDPYKVAAFITAVRDCSNAVC